MWSMRQIWSRWRGRVVFALFLASLALVHAVRRPGPAADAAGKAEGALDLEMVRRIFPEAAGVRLAGAGGWTLAYGPDGRRLGAVVCTSPDMDAVTGYAGPVPVLIGVDPEGIIAGLLLLENHETSGFVRRVDRAGFLNHWLGLPLAEAKQLEVDAVSMATLTSTAIARSIRGRLAMLEGLPLAEAEARAGGGIAWQMFCGRDAAIAALVLAVALSAWRAGPLKNARVFRAARTGIQIASVALLGFVWASMFSMALLEGWAVAGRIHGGAGVFLLAVVVLGFPVATGRNLYCQGLCPFGSAQELLWKLSPRKRHLPHAVSHRLRGVRYALLAAVILSMIAGRGLSPEWQEPFSAFRWAAASWPARILAGLALLVAAAGYHRPWCSYFCSSGALLDLIRKTPKSERKAPWPVTACP